MNRRVLFLIVLGSGAGLACWKVWSSKSGAADAGAAKITSPADSPTAFPTSVVPVDPLFDDGTERAGIKFFIDPGPLELYELPQVIGSGGAFLDFDQDGLLDVFLVNQAGGSGFSGNKEPAQSTAPGPTSRLYRQQADGAFADVTTGSGLDVVGVGMGVAVGDVNNDGFPDICATYFRQTRLFLNRRNGTFIDITASAGIDNLLWATLCTFLDFDRDGWLDLVCRQLCQLPRGPVLHRSQRQP